jgi:hypothetical protein
MDQAITLIQNDALSVGETIGDSIGSIGIFTLIFYILMIIAYWKIFTKAGEAGWKSIIPIYNIYIFCRIIGISFWIYILGIPIIFGIVVSTISIPSSIITIISGIYSFFLLIYIAIKLGDAFKKSFLFKIGLIFLPNIFLLILAFGGSKYHRAAIKK